METITKSDVDAYFKVVMYLKRKQKGVLGIGKLREFDIATLQYQGIGEGMEWELASDQDLLQLQEQLYALAEEQ